MPHHKSHKYGICSKLKKNLLMHANKSRKKRVLTFCEVVGANHWGRKTERGGDGATGVRGSDSDRVRGNESESEWEWEWERDWEWEGMRVRVTVCFLNLVYLSFFECVQWWTRGPKGNRVQWTQFPLNQTESNELGFWAFKPSPMNLVSWLTNRVQWTWFLGLHGHSGHLSCWQNKKLEYNILDFITQKSTPLISNC